MDFAIPEEVERLRLRVRAFVDEVVIPAEPRDVGVHGPPDELRAELQAAAREAGLFAPHMPAELGGLGLDLRGQSVIFEEAGRSLLGPLALNCTAPDEGNMAMLERIANAEQRARYLEPLAAGRVRSCFAMTEPAPGAGSDPAMLATTATRTDGGWVLDGEKWFITGADGAAFAIVMARTGERISRGEGATMFLVDAGTPGFDVRRVVGSIDRISPGGHAHVVLSGVEVADDAVLGEVGAGYRYAQVRLAPARLTHCMRWAGVARRALDIAMARAAERTAFGRPLAEQGMIQQQIADSLIELDAGRLLVQHACWLIDTGQEAQVASSMAKVHVSETVGRVVDRAVQICGSLGVSEDQPLARFLAEVRPFRIYDGPNEAHRWSIARRAVRRTTSDQTKG
jgi:acyl-CoA dehydrogenase